MSVAAVTNSFTNGQVADAPAVNTNFSDLVAFLNANVVHVDGSKAFSAVQSGVTPTAAAHLATKGYVDGRVLGITTRTTDYGGIVQAPVDVLSVAVTVAASRRIRVTSHLNIFGNSEHARIIGHIWESGGSLGQVFDFFVPVAGDYSNQEASCLLTPSTGAHTYQVAVSVNLGACQVVATATSPVWVMVEDIGAV